KKELNREKREAGQARQERRRAAGKAEGGRGRPDSAAGGQVCGTAEAGRVAAQRVRDSGSQPLLVDRPAARLLPEIQAVANCSTRARLCRADSGHGQVELVAGS